MTKSERRMTNDDEGDLRRVESMAKGGEMGTEDERADDYGDQRGDQDCTCGDVLRSSGEGMLIGRSQIYDAFDGGIEPFGGPDESDGGCDRAPFEARDSEKEARCHHRDHHPEMNPGVRLGAQKSQDPLKCKG
jgi:hypothetical protein